MSNYLALTVMKQFANSPTMLALLADFDQWVDASQFRADFLANVWDISTAQGFGLDIWGRILGQSRYIQVEQTPGDNFGWNINPVGNVINAINQEFGIGDGTTTAFQLRGPDHQPATTSVVINSMTRQDWQGVVPVFNTSRTNLARFSQNLLGAAWNVRTETVTTGNPGAPDGSATLNKVVISTTSTVHAQTQDVTGLPNGTASMTVYVVPPAGTSTYSAVWLADQLTAGNPLWAVIINSSGQVTLNGGALAGGAATVTAVGGGVFKVTIQGTIAAGTARCSVAFTNSTSNPSPTFAGNGTDSYSAWGLMLTLGAPNVQGGYIPTTTAAASLTDWSVNGTGLVTFAQVPQGPAAYRGAAVLRWNGTYAGTMTGTQWQPWSQAPWFGGAAAGTTAFALADTYYRQLLLVKAAANIAASDCPSINALMRSMFGNRGRCYVGYDPVNPMHIGYHFEFFPTPVEKSIIESGLFPQPAGTTATYIYETLTYAPFGFAGANRGADPAAVTGWSQNPFYQP